MSNILDGIKLLEDGEAAPSTPNPISKAPGTTQDNIRYAPGGFKATIKPYFRYLSRSKDKWKVTSDRKSVKVENKLEVTFESELAARDFAMSLVGKPYLDQVSIISMAKVLDEQLDSVDLIKFIMNKILVHFEDPEIKVLRNNVKYVNSFEGVEPLPTSGLLDLSTPEISVKALTKYLDNFHDNLGVLQQIKDGLDSGIAYAAIPHLKDIDYFAASTSRIGQGGYANYHATYGMDNSVNEYFEIINNTILKVFKDEGTFRVQKSTVFPKSLIFDTPEIKRSIDIIVRAK